MQVHISLSTPSRNYSGEGNRLQHFLMSGCFKHESVLNLAPLDLDLCGGMACVVNDATHVVYSFPSVWVGCFITWLEIRSLFGSLIIQISWWSGWPSSYVSLTNIHFAAAVIILHIHSPRLVGHVNVSPMTGWNEMAVVLNGKISSYMVSITAYRGNPL